MKVKLFYIYMFGLMKLLSNIVVLKFSKENPCLPADKVGNLLPGIAVSCSLSSIGITGPFFFEGTVTDTFLATDIAGNDAMHQ
jgi:hypothetical protein